MHIMLHSSLHMLIFFLPNRNTLSVRQSKQNSNNIVNQMSLFVRYLDKKQHLHISLNNLIHKGLYVMLIYFCNLDLCRSRFEQGSFMVQSCCVRQQSAVRAAVDLSMCGTKHWNLTSLFVTCPEWPASVLQFTLLWTKWRNRGQPRTHTWTNTRLSARQGKWWDQHNFIHCTYS